MNSTSCIPLDIHDIFYQLNKDHLAVVVVGCVVVVVGFVVVVVGLRWRFDSFTFGCNLTLECTIRNSLGSVLAENNVRQNTNKIQCPQYSNSVIGTKQNTVSFENTTVTLGKVVSTFVHSDAKLLNYSL